MLEAEPRAPVRVLLVWMPVLPTDVASPRGSVLAKVTDARASQHWDPKRALSTSLLRAASAGRINAPETFGRNVVWDFVMTYPPGVTWSDSIPQPDYYGGPIVDARVTSQLRARVKASSG